MTNTLAKSTVQLVESNSVVVEERTLTFESIDDDAALRDVETGTTWDPFTLEAPERPLSGTASSSCRPPTPSDSTGATTTPTP